MGRELISASQTSRDSLTLSNKVLRAGGCDWEGTSRLGNSRLSQPVTSAVQIALWIVLVLFPREYVATAPARLPPHMPLAPYPRSSDSNVSVKLFCEHGSLLISRYSAYCRGRCSSMAKELNSTRGAMMAAGAGEAAFINHLSKVTRGEVTPACVNSPESTQYPVTRQQLKNLVESFAQSRSPTDGSR